MEGLVNSKPRVFISFNTADDITAQDLKRALEASGSFSDVFEYGQHPVGTLWKPATDTKIKDADLFIVLVSNASIKSDEVSRECEVARHSEKDRGQPRVVPVFIKEIPELTSYEQSTLQWLKDRVGVTWTAAKTAEAVVRELQNSTRTDERSRVGETGQGADPRGDSETEVVFRVRQNDRFLHIVQVQDHTDSFEPANVMELRDNIAQIRHALDQLCKRYLENRPGYRTDALAELRSLANAGYRLKNKIFGKHVERVAQIMKGKRQCWFLIENAPVTLYVPWGLFFDRTNTDQRIDKMSEEELKDRFWCMKRSVATILSHSDDRRSINELLRVSLNRTEVLGVFNPDAVTYASDSDTGEWPQESVCYSTREFKAKLSKVNDGLFYFFCDSDPQDHRGSLYLRGTEHPDRDALTPNKIKVWAAKLRTPHRAFLFLNGCTTCATPAASDWMTATAKLKHVCIVVTEAPVPTRFAWLFGRALLRRALVDGEPPANALSHLQQKHWPLGLIYSLYSHTTRTLIEAPGIDFPESTDENYSTRIFGQQPYATLPFGASQ